MVQVFIDGVGSEALIAALKLLYYGKCELLDVSEEEVKEAANALGFPFSKDNPASRASPLAFHQDSPPQADPWGSGGEAPGGRLPVLKINDHATGGRRTKDILGGPKG